MTDFAAPTLPIDPRSLERAAGRVVHEAFARMSGKPPFVCSFRSMCSRLVPGRASVLRPAVPFRSSSCSCGCG